MSNPPQYDLLSLSKERMTTTFSSQLQPFVQQIVLDGFAFVGIRNNLLDCYRREKHESGSGSPSNARYLPNTWIPAIVRLYIHIEQIAFDFAAEDYADERDRVTAAYELGERILKRRAAKDSRVKRLQKRLACLGYDAGEPDGVFGAQTEAAVRGFQKISGAQFGLKVDGIVGDQTKEALTYPRKWLL